MEVGKKIVTLPKRSRYPRRQFSDEHGPFTFQPNPPSVSAKNGYFDETIAPPMVRLFGTVGKSPQVVRKTVHAKGGSFHSLAPLENVHREITRSVKYKPAPILAHTIVINQTTEILRDLVDHDGGSKTQGVDGIGKREDAVILDLNGAGNHRFDGRDVDIHKFGEDDGAVFNFQVQDSESSKIKEEIGLAQEWSLAAEQKFEANAEAETKMTIDDLNKGNDDDDNDATLKEEEDHWVTETEEIRWKIITESYSDGTVRRYTLKEGDGPRVLSESNEPCLASRDSPIESAFPAERGRSRSVSSSYSWADLEAAERHRHRLAEIEYLQEQLDKHLGGGDAVADDDGLYRPTYHSTPMKDAIGEARFLDVDFVSSRSSTNRFAVADAASLYSSELGAGMPESDQHLAAAASSAGFRFKLDDVSLSDNMSFDAMAAEIRRTMTQSRSVLGSLIEMKGKGFNE